MISPPYTPFAEHEVRHALGLSRRVYLRAVRSGALARSVHFDCRVSPVTALHSLVDVVRFDVLFRAAPEQAQSLGFATRCDSWLEDLCDAHEDCEALGRTANFGDKREVMALILPECSAPLNYDPSDMWGEEIAVLSLVVDSWCRCYCALHEMLVASDLLNEVNDLRLEAAGVVDQPCELVSSDRIPSFGPPGRRSSGGH